MKSRFPLCFQVLSAVCRESSGGNLPPDEPMPVYVGAPTESDFEKAEKDLKAVGYDELTAHRHGYNVGSGFEPGQTEREFFLAMGPLPDHMKEKDLGTEIVLPTDFPQSAIDLVESWL